MWPYAPLISIDIYMMWGVITCCIFIERLSQKIIFDHVTRNLLLKRKATSKYLNNVFENNPLARGGWYSGYHNLLVNSYGYYDFQ